MSGMDQTIVRSRHISLREKILVLGMLVLVCAACMVPVSQAAHNRELSLRMARMERDHASMEEQQRLSSARIAEARIPEQTMRQSVLKGLSLEKIVFEEAKIVSVGE
ncbi:MAG: hypothetical protein WCY74_02940 [Sphaerochaetaceae bacterium]|jgi:hypothetical protein|nr:hypothetical protein [Sphaerochaetaceae bacterium]MDD3942198.1 hypothetical protein [Sphaerochaetaceae bacterium]MDX9940397.1 hypothetical protein [Sphaerochaetaceae bacterium]